MFVGPGQTEDQIQPVESDRVSSTISNAAFPVDSRRCSRRTSSTTRTTGSTSRAPTPTNTRSRSGSISTPRRCSRSSGGSYTATAAYIGSQGRNLFLRSVANQITQVVTNPNPASAAFVIREFSIVQRDAAGNITGVQNPYAEVDYKTSGGHDDYNAMMLQLDARARRPASALNVQYTLGKSTRQHRRLERGAHRRRTTRAS